MTSRRPGVIVVFLAVTDSVVSAFAVVVVSAVVFAVVVASAVLVTANAVAAANTATAPPTTILVRTLRMVCLPLSPRALVHEDYMPTAIDPWHLLPVQVTGLRSARDPVVGYPKQVGIYALPCAWRLPRNRARGLGVMLPVRVHGTGAVDSGAAHRLAFRLAQCS